MPRAPLRLLPILLASAALFVAAAGDLHAGDDPTPGQGAKPGKKTASSKKAEKRGTEHLDFKRTYAQALREARIRNLPVFVSRHKDF